MNSEQATAMSVSVSSASACSGTEVLSPDALA